MEVPPTPTIMMPWRTRAVDSSCTAFCSHSGVATRPESTPPAAADDDEEEWGDDAPQRFEQGFELLSWEREAGVGALRG